MLIQMLLAIAVAAISGGLAVHVANRNTIKRLNLNNFEITSKLCRERNEVDVLGGKLTELRNAERKRVAQLQAASAKGTAASKAAAARRREEKAVAAKAMLSSVGSKPARHPK